MTGTNQTAIISPWLSKAERSVKGKDVMLCISFTGCIIQYRTGCSFTTLLNAALCVYHVMYVKSENLNKPTNVPVSLIWYLCPCVSIYALVYICVCVCVCVCVISASGSVYQGPAPLRLVGMSRRGVHGEVIGCCRVWTGAKTDWFMAANKPHSGLWTVDTIVVCVSLPFVCVWERASFNLNNKTLYLIWQLAVCT